MTHRSRWVVAFVLVTCAIGLGMSFLERKAPAVGVVPQPTRDLGPDSVAVLDESGPGSVRALADVAEVDAPEKVQPVTGVAGLVFPDEVEAQATTEALHSAWSAQYSGWTVPALQGELADLERQVKQLSKEPLKARYEHGLYDEVGVGPEVPMDRVWDPNVVMNVVVGPFGSEYFKIVLPRAEFPEIYLLHDKKLWVAGEIHRRGD